MVRSLNNLHLLEVDTEIFKGTVIPCLGFALKIFQPDETKQKEKRKGKGGNTYMIRIAAC